MEARQAERKEKILALEKKVIEDWMREEPEKKEKAKKAKGEQDKLAAEGLKEYLREREEPPEQIEAMLKGKKDDAKKYVYETRPAIRRPTYIRVHKKDLLPETLDTYNLPWSYEKVSSSF